MNKLNIVLFITVLFATVLIAQDLPRLSPKASVSQTVGYTVINIEYGRPAVRNRKIWDGLVPYNKVWRTGANEATTIQFTTDVTIEGKKVPAGIYSLFTIPNENEWTVIINKAFNVWGLYYVEEEDLLRFQVKPVADNYIERLQFSFGDITDFSTNVIMNWEKVRISFRVEVDLENQVHTKMKEAIALHPNDPKVYYKSAEYAADNYFFLEEALQWTNKSISIEANFYVYFVKAKVLLKLKKFQEAARALDKCREMGRNDKDYESYSLLIDMLDRQIKDKLK